MHFKQVELPQVLPLAFQHNFVFARSSDGIILSPGEFSDTPGPDPKFGVSHLGLNIGLDLEHRIRACQLIYAQSNSALHYNTRKI